LYHHLALVVYVAKWLPTVLLPADDVVPLEILDGGIPIGGCRFVEGTGEEHADYATFVGLYVEIVHVVHQL
jgi:hypothetical protein